jgi:hypothetical protein
MKTANKTFTGILNDIIDTLDLIERFESLESLLDNEGGTFNENLSDDEKEEFDALKKVLADIKGLGGDEQWRGDWYPVKLICNDYFTAYTKDLLEDCGTIPRDFPAWIAIDWERTAASLKHDYTPVDIAGHTYWTR